MNTGLAFFLAFMSVILAFGVGLGIGATFMEQGPDWPLFIQIPVFLTIMLSPGIAVLSFIMNLVDNK